MHYKPCVTAIAAIMVSTSAVALAQQNKSATASASSNVATTTADYSKSMDQLQRAAQRLRESIQSLSQQPAGPKRDDAMRAAREALWDAQQAMVRLPPELRSAPAGTGSSAVAPKYEDSMRDLKQASDRLYSAIHAMAGQAAGERRNQAIRQARESLFESEQAMLALLNTDTAVGASSSTAAGGSSGKGQKGGDDKADAAGSLPVVVLFPATTKVDTSFSKGCWARLYAEQNFRGENLTISGPGDIAYLRTSYANFLRKWDSIAVGPKASLLAYDNPNYTQPVASFKPGQRVSDLDDKLGFFENVRAVRLACGK